ncbi:MAG: sugar kinase [bacterium]|nr:sugar kinase [bacterium]
MLIENIQDQKPKEKIYASFGEIMLRLSAPGFERLFQSPSFDALFGGGESNVLVSLSLQGQKTRFISALPNSEIGHACLRTLRGYGIDVSQVYLDKEARMGLYFMEKGANQRPSQVIYDRDNTAISTIKPKSIDWETALEGCGWFHITGITPALSARAADEGINGLVKAREKGLIVSCDLNYRAKLWNYGVKPKEIMSRYANMSDILIANEEDCQRSLGIDVDIDFSGDLNKDRYRILAERVLEEYPGVKGLAITLRESISASHNKWSACLHDRENFYLSREYDIANIIDRVGGGDSFSAGLIHGLSHLPSTQEALDYAVAASCLCHSIEGDANLSTSAEIENLYQGDASGRIKR